MHPRPNRPLAQRRRKPGLAKQKLAAPTLAAPTLAAPKLAGPTLAGPKLAGPKAERPAAGAKTPAATRLAKAILAKAIPDAMMITGHVVGGLAANRKMRRVNCQRRQNAKVILCRIPATFRPSCCAPDTRFQAA